MRKAGRSLMLGYSVQAAKRCNLKQAVSLLAYAPPFKEMTKHTQKVKEMDMQYSKEESLKGHGKQGRSKEVK
jgi:hypothetical protein